MSLFSKDAFGALVEQFWDYTFEILKNPAALRPIDPEINPHVWLVETLNLIDNDTLFVRAAEEFLSLEATVLRDAAGKFIPGYEMVVREGWCAVPERDCCSEAERALPGVGSMEAGRWIRPERKYQNDGRPTRYRRAQADGEDSPWEEPEDF